jgi:hypothetical protein
MPERARGFILLIRLSATLWRAAWALVVTWGLVIPIALVAVAQGAASSHAASKSILLAAAVVLPLAGIALVALPALVADLRARGTITLLGTLPVERAAVMLAIASIALLAAVPGVILTAASAAHVLALHLDWQPWLLLLAPLTFAAMAGIGFIIGSLAADRAGALVAGNIVFAVVSAAVPLTQTSSPAIARFLFTLTPGALAAHAGADLFSWTGLGDILPEIVALAIYVGVLLPVADRLWPWRAEKRAGWSLFQQSAS